MTKLQMETALSSEDFAKYPFLKQASKQIEELQFTIGTLSSEKPVFDRAQEPSRKSNLGSKYWRDSKGQKGRNFFFCRSTYFGYRNQKFVDKKRYALAVAKTAHVQMLSENKGKIFAIAQDFDWNIAKGALWQGFSYRV